MDQHEVYPFLQTLEDNWEVILEELDNLLYNETVSNISLFKSWHEKEIYVGDWDVFGLYAFGKKIDENCQRCPKTTEIIESIPGLTMAGFSALAPDTYIKPHVGYTDKVLRCHLGLIKPKALERRDRCSSYKTESDTCGLKVADKIYHWEPGKAFVFDDTLLHEAWNWGDRTRFILLIDFLKLEGGATP